MLLQMPLIVIRLFAIYFFMQSIAHVPMSFSSYYTNPAETRERLDLLVTVLNVFICILVFCYPRTLLVGLHLTHAELSQRSGWVKLFQAAGLALIGFYFAMRGLQDLVYYNILSWKFADYSPLMQGASPEDTAGFWTALVELGVGVLVIAASGGLSNFISRLRDLKPVSIERSNLE